MIIIVRPSDLIERFVWDKYEYFCLDGKSNAEINEIITKNEEFQISEKDAFVIGLTSVIYTEEVIYKFKQFILEILTNKNVEFEKRLYIGQQTLLDSLNDFKSKIPKNWSSTDPGFNAQLNILPEKIELFKAHLEQLKTTNIQDWPCLKCGQVKKIIHKI
ncbi:MAG: hypothetical protein E6R13_05335 [Spirochaetes bacterium]|nr:MAG: hypothetical protein E6R13_05335 [Spirochaetota bacterium]